MAGSSAPLSSEASAPWAILVEIETLAFHVHTSVRAHDFSDDPRSYVWDPPSTEGPFLSASTPTTSTQGFFQNTFQDPKGATRCCEVIKLNCFQIFLQKRIFSEPNRSFSLSLFSSLNTKQRMLDRKTQKCYPTEVCIYLFH